MKNENQYLILYINQILRLKCLLINIYNQKEPMTAFKIFLSLDLAHYCIITILLNNNTSYCGKHSQSLKKKELKNKTNSQRSFK